MRFWWFLGLCGCGCESMRDVYVSGSPRDVVVRVRKAADEFLASTTREACVAELRVVDRAKGKWDGRYKPVGKQTWIQSDTSHPDLVTRHELCHAVDLQHGLSFEDPDAYTLTREEHPGLLAVRPSEGFAYRCQAGSLPIWLMTEASCPDDDADPTWDWIRDDIYDVTPARWLEDGPEWVELGRLTVPEARGDAFRECHGHDQDRLSFWQTDDNGLYFDAVHLWTGERAVFGTATSLELDGFENVPRGWVNRGGHALGDTAVVYAKAHLDALDVFELPRLQPERHRLLVNQDGKWKSSTECWKPLCSFPFGDAIGMAYEDGDTLVWGRWVE